MSMGADSKVARCTENYTEDWRGLMLQKKTGTVPLSYDYGVSGVARLGRGGGGDVMRSVHSLNQSRSCVLPIPSPELGWETLVAPNVQRGLQGNTDWPHRPSG